MRWTRSRLSCCWALSSPWVPAQERAREPEDHGHRRAQLVGDGGEEAVLQGGGALQLLAPCGRCGCAAPRAARSARPGGGTASARRSLAEALASATARLGAIAVSVLRARSVKGLTAPSARTPTASSEVHERQCRLSRGRMRPSKRSTVGLCASTETRMGFPSRAARIAPARAAASSTPAEPPTDAAGREPVAAVGEVDDGARRAGHLEDLLEQLRAEAREVVDRGGRGEDRVDGRLDVPGLERLRRVPEEARAASLKLRPSSPTSSRDASKRRGGVPPSTRSRSAREAAAQGSGSGGSRPRAARRARRGSARPG